MTWSLERSVSNHGLGSPAHDSRDLGFSVPFLHLGLPRALTLKPWTQNSHPGQWGKRPTTGGGLRSQAFKQSFCRLWSLAAKSVPSGEQGSVPAPTRFHTVACSSCPGLLTRPSGLYRRCPYVGHVSSCRQNITHLKIYTPSLIAQARLKP